MTKHVINPQLSALDHKQYSWRNSPPVKQVSPGSEKERALADDIGTMELCHVALQRLEKNLELERCIERGRRFWVAREPETGTETATRRPT